MKTYSGDDEDEATMHSKAPTIQWVFWLSLACLLGCNDKPARIKPPAIDAKASAKQAIELFDADSSGSIDKSELAASPGLEAVLDKVDTDANGELSEDELQTKFQSMADSASGVLPATITVVKNGRPLQGVRVVLDPEPFFGDVIVPAEGETDLYGMAALRSPAVRGGMQLGIYRIRITKSENNKETIPAKYNAETTLGIEISSSSPAITSTRGYVIEI
ncbi:MAG: EF-hand domain-containing protein, partial [Planctomycetota bacterium]